METHNNTRTSYKLKENIINVSLKVITSQFSARPAIFVCVGNCMKYPAECEQFSEQEGRI